MEPRKGSLRLIGAATPTTASLAARKRVLYCLDLGGLVQNPLRGYLNGRVSCTRPQSGPRPPSSDLGASPFSEPAPGVVEAPDKKAAEAAAITEFNLSDEQRKRLVVQEQD